MGTEGPAADEDTWWYVCTLCFRAFAEDSRLLKTHKRTAHDSKGTSNMLILYQATDLKATVKITPCSVDRTPRKLLILDAVEPPPERSPTELVGSEQAMQPDWACENPGQSQEEESPVVQGQNRRGEVNPKLPRRKRLKSTHTNKYKHCSLSFHNQTSLKTHVLLAHVPDPVNNTAPFATQPDAEVEYKQKPPLTQTSQLQDSCHVPGQQPDVLIKEDLPIDVMPELDPDPFAQITSLTYVTSAFADGTSTLSSNNEPGQKESVSGLESFEAMPRLRPRSSLRHLRPPPNNLQFGVEPNSSSCSSSTDSVSSADESYSASETSDDEDEFLPASESTKSEHEEYYRDSEDGKKDRRMAPSTQTVRIGGRRAESKYKPYYEHDTDDVQTPYKCLVCFARFSECRRIVKHLTKVHRDHVRANCEGMTCECPTCHRNAFLRPQTAKRGAWQCKLCERLVNETAIKSHVNSYHQEQKLSVLRSANANSTLSEWKVARQQMPNSDGSIVNDEEGISVSPPNTDFQYPTAVKVKRKRSRYSCPVCNKSYVGKANFRSHMVELHTQRQELKCTKCDKVFSMKRSLRNHFITVHNKSRDHLCSTCGAAFKSVSELKIHTRYHDQMNRTHVCEICNRRFFRISALNVHLSSHNAREIMCPDCGLLLKNERGLKSHLKYAHIALRPYKCDKCDASFKNSNGLKRHAAAHVEGTPHLCPQCPKAFKTEFSLKDHVKSTHSHRPKIHVCRVCKQKFPGKVTLRRHELEVHAFKRSGFLYECTFCDKKFSQGFNLRQHEVSHTGERRYQCEHAGCGKAFLLGAHLRNHSFSHLPYDKLPHVCDAPGCGKRFGVPAQLRNHKRRIHEKEKLAKVGKGDDASPPVGAGDGVTQA